MLRLLSGRLLLGLATLWVISVLVFSGTEILPGDVAAAVLGQSATEEAKSEIRKRLRLDRPAAERYVEWLFDFARGDLGDSLASGRPVAKLLGERLKNTLILAGLTALIAVPLSVGLGLLMAAFPETVFDRTVTVSSLVLISLPEFFTGAVLVVLFALTWRLFPAVTYVTEFESFGEMLRALVLPMITLIMAMLAHMSRMTRAAVLDVLRTPYVEMAILKGVPRGRIVLRHALPNALGPIANVVALNLGFLVSGVVVVEAVFAYPGIGRLMVDSVSLRDVPMVQAIALIFCAVYVGLNLLADLISIVANPRLRYAK